MNLIHFILFNIQIKGEKMKNMPQIMSFNAIFPAQSLACDNSVFTHHKQSNSSSYSSKRYLSPVGCLSSHHLHISDMLRSDTELDAAYINAEHLKWVNWHILTDLFTHLFRRLNISKQYIISSPLNKCLFFQRILQMQIRLQELTQGIVVLSASTLQDVCYTCT